MDENTMEERIKVLEGLTISPIEPNTIMNTIVPHNNKKKMSQFMDWRVNLKVGVVETAYGDAGGVMLKLNHVNYKQCLFITSSFLDFYNVHFVSVNFKVLRSIENIPKEKFFDTINKELNFVHEFPYAISPN
jgi:hypothetical protein